VLAVKTASPPCRRSLLWPIIQQQSSMPRGVENAMSTPRKRGPMEPLVDKTWRTFTAVVVVGLGAAVLVVPLVLLIPLLIKSLDPSNPGHGLIWLWASMTFIELCLAIFIIWGMFRTAFGLWQGPLYPER
jgi:hypothetical protein